MRADIQIYGFENYRVTTLSEYALYQSERGWYLPANYWFSSDIAFLNKGLAVDVDSPKFKNGIISHKELLQKASTVYVHPSCTFSRALLSTKYKKCLNPWIADAVVIPNMKKQHDYDTNDVIVFINESVETIIVIFNYDINTQNAMKATPLGTKLASLVTKKPLVSGWNSPVLTEATLLDSELLFVGTLLRCSPKSIIQDIVTGQLPLDKTVYEQDVQNTLGSEDNKITFEALVSIENMLSSNDDSVVEAAYKSLSMMDWMHYPNSVRYILNNIPGQYNKVWGATSVKFMFRTLSGSKRSGYAGGYDKFIYKKDYELFKQLKCKFENVEESNVCKALKYCNFMIELADGKIIPNIKEEER